jgi:hypothetical protein
MTIPPIRFYRTTSPQPQEPLSRYLPPMLEGAASAWLSERLPIKQGDDDPPWVLDPFGASPRVCVEAARAGYRVLVAANNPISRFLIEMAANPPSVADLQAALAELASSSRGDERMEPHIRGLYHTQCAQCSQTVMADAFLWEKGALAPYARSYTCPACGSSGEFPATSADIERARPYASGGLHRARALERVASADDPDRQHAEEALSVYLPRAVYALFTLINKLDGLNLPAARRDLLAAMLLYACDQGNTLWQHPARRERPRQLSLPSKFRENNIWLALEKSIPLWATGQASVPLSVWPELPPASGGICLFEGRLRDLEGLLEHAERLQRRIGAVLAPLPRPNQAFWTLSALWAGWLWGRSAVGPFKSVLRRRRYDWAWYASGMQVAFNSLKPVLSLSTPLLGLIGEAEAGYLSSALLGADVAGFDLRGLALRLDPPQAQIHWQLSSATLPPPPASLSQALTQRATAAAQDFLRQLGQPAQHLRMHAAATTGLVEAHIFRSVSVQTHSLAPAGSEAAEPTPAENFNQAQAALRDLLTYRGGFLRFGATDSAESGSWWLREAEGSALPAADRVEKTLVNYLLRHPGCRFADLEEALNAEFPGMLTPSLELINVCLDSYAVQDPPESGAWRLRPQDEPAARRQDIEDAYAQLQSLAGRFGYLQEGTPPVWLDEQGQPRFWFYPIASAVIGELMLGKPGSLPTPADGSIIVLPGGRANLLAYKLRYDPRLAAMCASLDEHSSETPSTGWRFLKFRHLRQLLDHPMLLRENFAELLTQDPLTYSAPQMRLF